MPNERKEYKEKVITGKQFTFGDMYAYLFSAYWNEAEQRDLRIKNPINQNIHPANRPAN